MHALSEWVGRRLSVYLTRSSHHHSTSIPPKPADLLATLRPGDVLLVEGQTRVSTAIKYLTQSTWSHAALFVGDVLGARNAQGENLCFVEADIAEGVRAVPVSQYYGLHTRICRPVNVSQEQLAKLLGFICSKIGNRYDLKNVIDLARYLLPTPPVPVRWRRRLLAIGSGDPTRAICSTLIAQAFESVQYPILPFIDNVPTGEPECPDCTAEILRVRHHSLYVPRDFDVSPYFEIVKPTLARGFDPSSLRWAKTQTVQRSSKNASSLSTGMGSLR